MEANTTMGEPGGAKPDEVHNKGSFSHPFKLKPSTLAAYFHLGCDLFLHSSAADAAAGRKKVPSEFTSAILERGNAFEEEILAILRDANSVVIDFTDRGLNTLFSDRELISHLCNGSTVYAYQPQLDLNDLARTRLGIPRDAQFDFSTFFPDFLCIEPITNTTIDGERREGSGGEDDREDEELLKEMGCDVSIPAATVCVIDAKSSVQMKVSHQIQITFYAVAIEGHCNDRGIRWQISDTGKVWRPKDQRSNTTAIVSDQFSIRLARPFLIDVCSSKAGVVLQQSALPEWNLTEKCLQCDYVAECRTRALQQGDVNALPNLSKGDRRWWRKQLHAYRSHGDNSSSAKTQSMCDIEDIARMVSNDGPLHTDNGKQPQSVLLRASRTLKLRPASSVCVSAPKLLPSFSPRSRETTNDTEAITDGISSLKMDDERDNKTDPSHSSALLSAFGVTSMVCRSAPRVEVQHGARCRLMPASERFYDYFILGRWMADQLWGALQLLSSSENYEKNRSPPSVQVYVSAQHEKSLLLNMLVRLSDPDWSESFNEKLPWDHSIAWKCLLALCDDATLLQTPLTYAMRDDLEGISSSASTDTVDQLKRRLVSIGVPLAAKETKTSLLKKYKEAVADTRRDIVARPPRISVLQTCVSSLLVLPCPGIYTFNDCKFWLLDNCGNAKDYEELLKQNALSEELYRLWKNSEECGFDVAEKLKDVSASVFAIICKVRALLGSDILTVLPERAQQIRILPDERLEHPQLQRLLFTAQFEALTDLSEKRTERVHGEKAVRLEYGKQQPSPSPVSQEGPDKYRPKDTYYTLIEGGERLKIDDRQGLYQWILFQDVTRCGPQPQQQRSSPDLDFSDAIFSHRPYVSFPKEDKKRYIPKGLCLADAIAFEGRTVTLLLGLCGQPRHLFSNPATSYLLRQRFVDLNLSKTVQSLISTDDLHRKAASGKARQQTPVFVQVLEDPNGFSVNGVDQIASAAISDSQHLRMKQSLFSKKTLRLMPERLLARRLILNSSQGRAYKHTSSHRLQLLWGPPGTGKTHYLSVMMIRWMEEAYRSGREHFRILVTANTHTAIDNLIGMLVEQRQIWRRVQRNIDESAPVTPMRIIRAHSEFYAPETCLPDVDYEVDSRLKPELERFTVVGSTVWSAFKMKKAKYDAVVVDEGTQLRLADASIVIQQLEDSSQSRIVIAGDHFQLPPIVRGTYPPPPNDRDPLPWTSIMSGLMRDSRGKRVDPLSIISCIDPPATRRKKPSSSSDELEHLLGPCVVKLSENRRSNNIISSFVRSLYDSTPFLLEEVLRSHLRKSEATGQQARALPVHCLVTVHLRLRDVDGYIPFEEQREIESMVIKQILYEIEMCCPLEESFVVTPHRVQKCAIRNALRGEALPETSSVEVDHYCPERDKYHVHGDSAATYSVTLHQTNTKVVVIQVLTGKNSNEFYFFQRWGTVGDEQMRSVMEGPFDDDLEPISLFEKKFEMKTGNSWKERDSFSNRNGMYIPETLKLAKPSQLLSSAGDEDDANTSSQHRVDTVDRMQGQQADVVCVAGGLLDEDALANEIEFIYDFHRLNVAFSRAKRLCVLVASPQLLNPSPEILAGENQRKAYSLLLKYRTASYEVYANVTRKDGLWKLETK